MVTRSGGIFKMKTKKLNTLKARIIGSIGVDAGFVWIGDPCYILHQKKLPKTLGKNWHKFCDLLKNENPKSFNFERGHEGLGICTSTKHGDGLYNVIGFFEKGSDRPSCVVVDFDGVFSRRLCKL